VTFSFLITNFFTMQDKKEQKGRQTKHSSLPAAPQALHALATIHTFTRFYPPPQAKEALWQLHAAAMGSTIADAWEAGEREMQVLFYRMLGELFDTLPALQRV
jgi:hypothetical protein